MACYYQYFPMEIKRQGWGDCHNCTPDEKNKECKGYCPCSFITFTIEGKEDAQKTAQAKKAHRVEVIPFPKQKKPKQAGLARKTNSRLPDEAA